MMMTTTTLLERYALSNPLAPNSFQKYAKHLSKFRQWHGGDATIDILAERASEFVAYREGTVAPETASDSGKILRALLEFAAKRNWIPWPEVRQVKIKEVNPHALTKVQLKKLFRWATDFQRAAIRLAYDTGLRRSDLFRVRWDDVHEHQLKRPFKKSYFRLIVVQEKTGKVIERRVRKDTLKMLTAIRDEHDNRLLPWKKCPNAWDEAWRKMAKLAKVPSAGLQDIRRTGASYCAKMGLSAQEYLDHSGGATARKYYIDRRIASRPGPLPPTMHFDGADFDDSEPYEVASRKGLDRPTKRLMAGDDD